MIHEKKSVFKRMIEERNSYLFLAPYLILFTIFTLIPVLASVFLSFTNFNLLEMPTFAALENYVRMLFNDRVFLIALKNTAIFAFITGPISYFLCLILAWVINDFGPKLRSFLALVFYAPSIAGNAFIIWTFIFSGDSYGLINGMLIKIGIISEPIKWLMDPEYMMVVLIIVQIWMSLGAGFLSFIAGLQTLDNSIFESGAIDGIRNRWQEFFYLTIPSMKPQLMFGAVMQISASFAVSAVSMQLLGFPSTNYAGSTIVTHIMDVGTIRYEMGYASAIAVFLFGLMALTKIVISKLIKQD